MPQYFVTAKNPSGRTIIDLLEAESGQAAVQLLKDRGCEDIVLHTDNATTQTARHIDAMLTAGELRKNRFHGGPTIVLLAGRFFARIWEVVILVLIGMRRLSAIPWGYVDVLLFVALPLPEVVVFLATRPSLRFHRILQAESWRRWDEVLRLLPPLKGKLSNHAMALYEARALSGLGRVAEALEVVRPFATNGEIPESKFWSILISGVYQSANRPDLALAATEKALELAPNDLVALIDTAIGVLDEQRDAPRAKELLARAVELLAQAVEQPLSDVATKFVLIAEGMIATEEGNAQLAVEKLEAALKAQRVLAKRNATLASVADLVEGRLALAKALAGDLEAAQQHFRRAEPRLRVQGYQKLLGRCQQALGAHLLQNVSIDDNPYRSPSSNN